MGRADDLQAAWDQRFVVPGAASKANAAIPDLLAVVRAAEEHVQKGAVSMHRDLRAALAAFEEGG